LAKYLYNVITPIPTSAAILRMETESKPSS
jgi:hypothetical protein